MGGCVAPIKFNSLSEELTGASIQIEVTKFTKHSVITSGVNFVGQCSTQKCRINNVKQYFKKGFGTFIVKKEVLCQTCIACTDTLTNENVTNVMFYNCKFSIEGYSNGVKTEMKNR